MFQTTQDADGIVTISIDDPDQSVNTLNGWFRDSMAHALRHLAEARNEVSGVIVTSAKRTFVAGGDLNEIAAYERSHPQRAVDEVNEIKTLLRSLESYGRPVVAALDGAALGGGLELALSCHHRIATRNEKLVVGFPEIALGLLPGAGGTVRTVNMFGAQRALPLLLNNIRYGAEEALRVGLIDKVVSDATQLPPAARAGGRNPPDAAAPWDRDGFVVPAYRAEPASETAVPRSATEETHAAEIIRSATDLISRLDFSTACRVETEVFAHLATGPEAKRAISAFLNR